jgi:hypothetical protein
VSCEHGKGTACDECFQARAIDLDSLAHGARCVCPECMRHKFRPSLQAQLAGARAIRSDSVQRLDTHQRRLLNKFTRLWNVDRVQRGKRPMTDNDALTQGLEALISMLEQE